MHYIYLTEVILDFVEESRNTHVEANGHPIAYVWEENFECFIVCMSN